MAKRSIVIKGEKIRLEKIDQQDFVNLTDMTKGFEGGSSLIEKWLRNQNSIEFLGVWEQLNNKNFNSPEFGGIRSEAGTNRFGISVKRWISQTSAIGLKAKAGRYGGTYAHEDIALEFGSWLSPHFKLLLITEFKRLKKKESDLVGWDYNRFLSKVNYRLQTDAIKENLIPSSRLPKSLHGLIYASEADILNIAVFGVSAKQWKKANPDLAKTGNIRDYADTIQLTVLAGIESINSDLIDKGVEKEDRIKHLRETAVTQLERLYRSIKAINPDGTTSRPLIEKEGTDSSFRSQLSRILGSGKPKS